jgi:hypothetical protein
VADRVAGGVTGGDVLEKAIGGGSDFGYGLIEGFFIGFRWLGEAADFADELERGSRDFLIGGGLGSAAENFDAATHKGDMLAAFYHVK